MFTCAVCLTTRVLAPQEMFQLFCLQLRMLRENDDCFQKRYALLETLATLKMPVLLVELCRASDSADRDDAPLIELFNTAFEVTMYAHACAVAVDVVLDREMLLTGLAACQCIRSRFWSTSLHL